MFDFCWTAIVADVDAVLAVVLSVVDLGSGAVVFDNLEEEEEEEEVVFDAAGTVVFDIAVVVVFDTVEIVDLVVFGIAAFAGLFCAVAGF